MFNSWMIMIYYNLSESKLKTLFMHDSKLHRDGGYQNATPLSVPRTIQYAHIDDKHFYLVPPDNKEKTSNKSLARLFRYDNLVYNGKMLLMVNVAKHLPLFYRTRLNIELRKNFEKYILDVYGIRSPTEYRDVVRLGYMT